jgi:hypothetical protein
VIYCRSTVCCTERLSLFLVPSRFTFDFCERVERRRDRFGGRRSDSSSARNGGGGDLLHPHATVVELFVFRIGFGLRRQKRATQHISWSTGGKNWNGQHNRPFSVTPISRSGSCIDYRTTPAAGAGYTTHVSVGAHMWVGVETSETCRFLESCNQCSISLPFLL